LARLTHEAPRERGALLFELMSQFLLALRQRLPLGGGTLPHPPGAHAQLMEKGLRLSGFDQVKPISIQLMTRHKAQSIL